MMMVVATRFFFYLFCALLTWVVTGYCGGVVPSRDLLTRILKDLRKEQMRRKITAVSPLKTFSLRILSNRGRHCCTKINDKMFFDKKWKLKIRWCFGNMYNSYKIGLNEFLQQDHQDYIYKLKIKTNPKIWLKLLWSEIGWMEGEPVVERRAGHKGDPWIVGKWIGPGIRSSWHAAFFSSWKSFSFLLSLSQCSGHVA